MKLSKFRFLAISLLVLAGHAQAACDTDQGVRFKFGGSASAVWVTWWCPPVSRWMDFTADGGSLSLAATPDLIGKVAAGVVSGSTANLRALATGSLADGAKAQQLATRPPAPVVVKSNGSTPTRPTFAVIAATGLRSTNAQSKIRAPVGARAACWVTMVVEGTNVYCSWEESGAPVSRQIVTLVAEVK